jgi:hypothetical protein
MLSVPLGKKGEGLVPGEEMMTRYELWEFYNDAQSRFERDITLFIQTHLY